MKITNSADARKSSDAFRASELERVLWIITRRIRRNAAVGMVFYKFKGYLKHEEKVALKELGYMVADSTEANTTYILW